MENLEGKTAIVTGANSDMGRETGFGKTITRMLKPFFLTPEEGFCIE